MMTFTAKGELERDHVKITNDNIELKIGLSGLDYPTPEEILVSSALSWLTVYYIAREEKPKFKGVHRRNFRS